ncbi:MAG: hemolysin family protein [Planctomycetota bacterium]
MLLFVVSVTFALVVSFLCSISEATLLSVSQGRIEALAAQGRRAGHILRRFKQQPDRPIAAILVLNTVANTAGATVAGATFHDAFPGVADVWFVMVFTASVLLFTEIAPKTIGVVHAGAVAVPVAHLVEALVIGLRPVLWLTRFVSRLVGTGSALHQHSLEEIRLLATAGHAQGAFGSLTAEIIANATRLREQRVRDVMLPRNRVAYVSGTRTTEQNLKLVARTGHSRFPYTPTGELDGATGVVLTKELLFHLRTQQEPDWQQLLVPLLIVPETAKLNYVLRSFQREKRHMALVVDEYGAVQGIVTLEDVLEEIVGEIQDELDDDEAHVIARADGSFYCRGAAEARKVFERLGLRDVDTQSQTVSGFLTEQLGDVPWAGAEVDFRGWRFAVTKANNRRAERVRIAPVPAPGSDPAPAEGPAAAGGAGGAGGDGAPPTG